MIFSFKINVVILRITKVICGIFLIVGISACDYIALPQYWVCNGQNLQILENMKGEMLDQYAGNQKLMLEIHNGVVSQFASPAAFGRYEVCIQTPKQVFFEFPACTDFSTTVEKQPAYHRWGVLNFGDGNLAFGDERWIDDIRIRSGGNFSCQYLGRQYSYSDMFLTND
jgi:hypothetical protein